MNSHSMKAQMYCLGSLSDEVLSREPAMNSHSMKAQMYCLGSVRDEVLSREPGHELSFNEGTNVLPWVSEG